jgi:hypothetical protein
MADRIQDQKNESREGLIRAIAGYDANAQLPLVTRTRRAIRIDNEIRREQSERERHHIGITLLAFGAILLALAPALWGSLDGFFGGEHFGDLPAQVTLIAIFLVLAVAGALMIVLRGRNAQDGYGRDH